MEVGITDRDIQQHVVDSKGPTREDGSWRVQLKRVLTGGLPVEECEDGQCSGIVDSGTSLLSVPSEFLLKILTQTVRQSIHVVLSKTTSPNLPNCLAD